MSETCENCIFLNAFYGDEYEGLISYQCKQGQEIMEDYISSTIKCKKYMTEEDLNKHIEYFTNLYSKLKVKYVEAEENIKQASHNLLLCIDYLDGYKKIQELYIENGQK